MMIRRILYVVAIALFAVGCGGNEAKSEAMKNYVVEGNIDDFVGKVEIKALVSEETLASSETTDGKFNFELESSTPILAAVVLNGMPVMPLFVDSEVITVKSVEGAIGATGSRSNDAYRKLLSEMHQLTEDAKSKGRVTMDDLATMKNREMRIVGKYYESNRNNLLGAYILMSKLSGYQVELEQALKDIESYPQEMKAMPEVQLLKRTTEAKAKTAVGKQYVDITLPDETGKMVSLSSAMEGRKLVLLYFWQANGVSFKRGAPFLISAYGDYRDKGFEIYGVNIDEDEQEWIGGVKGNGMTWINVRDSNVWESQSMKTYGIDAVPQGVLIHAQTGEIVARNVRPETLQQTLAEILK